MEFKYLAEVIRIIDGDTSVLKIDMGFRTFTILPIRLYGINTPEMNTEAGRLAKAEIERLLPVGLLVTVETYKNPADKYGRWLGVISKDGYNINRHMILKKFATAYYGIGEKK